LFTHHSLSM